MKYLLAISGSIASYKSIDVARSLVKSQHEVKVILTEGALEFIKPEVFRYLGVSEVYLPQDDFKPKFLDKNETVLHVELAKWADKIIIAPASAHSIAKFAHGLNNDLLGSVLLANPGKPVLIFPAMNTQMWLDSKTQSHIEILKKNSSVAIINPAVGLLACGDIGSGKFPDVNAVIDLIETINPNKINSKSIIVTAGATAAPLDPVRYLTNPSSGKMGISVAKKFLSEGYKVTVLAGHQCSKDVFNLVGHPHFQVFETPTTEKMKIKALDLFKNADLYISTGAIADIEFDVSTSKLKKENMGTSLNFHQAADILKEILIIKKPNQKVISFAAETDTTKEVFSEKMKRKPVDLMIGNKVSSGLLNNESLEGFQKESGEYYFVTQSDMKGPIALSKLELGTKLVDWFKDQIK